MYRDDRSSGSLLALQLTDTVLKQRLFRRMHEPRRAPAVYTAASVSREAVRAGIEILQVDQLRVSVGRWDRWREISTSRFQEEPGGG